MSDFRRGRISLISESKFGLIQPVTESDEPAGALVFFQKRSVRLLRWTDLNLEDVVCFKSRELAAKKGGKLPEIATLVTSQEQMQTIEDASERDWKSGVVSFIDSASEFGVIQLTDSNDDILDPTLFVVFPRFGRNSTDSDPDTPVVQLHDDSSNQDDLFENLEVGNSVEFQDFQLSAESGDRVASKVRRMDKALIEAVAMQPLANEDVPPAESESVKRVFADGVTRTCRGTVKLESNENRVDPRGKIELDSPCPCTEKLCSEFCGTGKFTFKKHFELKEKDKVWFMPAFNCVADSPVKES